jgi:hypothetical protein
VAKVDFFDRVRNKFRLADAPAAPRTDLHPRYMTPARRYLPISPILGRRTSVRQCCPGRRTHARQRYPEGFRRAGSYIQPLSYERLHSGGPLR